jgi:outer membrane protein TolC
MRLTRFSQALLVSVLSISSAGSFAETIGANTAESLLPDSNLIRQTLTQLPAMRTSRFQQDIADAQDQKLQSGGHEWQLRLSQTERKETGNIRTRDQEISLERPVRWFGKTEHDMRLGEKGREVAKIAYADSWHESARTLLNDWFDSLRTQAAVTQYEQQLQLSRQLRDIAAKRVKAGEAARLDLQLAETEVSKLEAQLQTAEMQHARQLELLQYHYPALKLPVVRELPIPSAASAEHRIEAIMEDNHELELATLEADYAKLQLSRTAKDEMPDPVIGVRAVRERNGQDTLIGFSIAIPLGGQSRRADTGQAAGKAGMAQARLDVVRQKVWREALKVTQQRNQMYTIWKALDQAKRQSEQQSQLMMKAYQLGEISLSDSLQIRKTALETAFSAQQAQLDALFAEARFELDAHRLWPFDAHH